MARPTLRLVTALRVTAARLKDLSVTYRWSHFAHCNCGQLAQTITHLESQDLQRRALQREGDWGAQATALHAPERKYQDGFNPEEGAWEPEDVGACAVTGAHLDDVVRSMLSVGLEHQDFQELERLSNPEVRRRLGANTRNFAHYERANVVAYLEAWADLLEARMGELEDAPPGLAIAAE